MKIPRSRVRTKRLTTLWNTHEYARLEAAAGRTGCSLGAFVRGACLAAADQPVAAARRLLATEVVREANSLLREFQ